MIRLAPLLLAVSVFLAPSWAHAFTVPGNDGFMTDATGILTPEQDAEIERILTDYRRQTTNEIAVLIAASLEGEHIADVAVQVGRAWKVGSKEDDNGILVLISYGDREAFIATGYGLEGAVPDLTAKSIIENEMIPQFREGRYYEGILAGIDSLKQSIGGEYVAEEPEGEGVDYGSVILVLLFMGVNALRFLGVFLAKTKSWWLGGVIGAGFGALAAIFLAWWWTVPLMAIAGLLFDYFVSKYGWASNPRRRRGGSWYIGGGGSGGGGGFGGFGGGSFGGGGAGGKW